MRAAVRLDLGAHVLEDVLRAASRGGEQQAAGEQQRGKFLTHSEFSLLIINCWGVPRPLYQFLHGGCNRFPANFSALMR